MTARRYSQRKSINAITGEQARAALARTTCLCEGLQVAGGRVFHEDSLTAHRMGVQIVDEFDHTEDMQLLARRNRERRARRFGLEDGTERGPEFGKEAATEPD